MNAAVQEELKAAGAIAATGVPFTVLDRVNATREGVRQMRAYQPGHVVEFRTDLPSQRMARGDRGVVTAIEGDGVRLRMASGSANRGWKGHSTPACRNCSSALRTCR